jgi:hypothetical protein
MGVAAASMIAINTTHRNRANGLSANNTMLVGGGVKQCQFVEERHGILIAVLENPRIEIGARTVELGDSREPSRFPQNLPAAETPELLVHFWNLVVRVISWKFRRRRNKDERQPARPANFPRMEKGGGCPGNRRVKDEIGLVEVVSARRSDPAFARGPRAKD